MNTVELTHLINELIAESWFSDLPVRECFLLPIPEDVYETEVQFAVIQETASEFTIIQVVNSQTEPLDHYNHYIEVAGQWFQVNTNEGLN